MHAWSVGDLLIHRYNEELGNGRVTAIDGRALVVHFEEAGVTLRFAATSDALAPGAEAPRQRDRPPLERLALGDIDDVDTWMTRLDVLRVLATREADGLGAFLGGRVHLFPHQLHVAERATARLPVRWLLADEVGLGKTIEAALIMNRLLHTQAIERCVVVAPESLTVQWLGELWRKYHQVFTLLDTQRLADVEHDFGAGFNPFDVHRRAVIALETLVQRPELTRQAVAAGIDLLVVDEAQRLRRRPGHPGEPEYRAVAPIAALGRHVLLLSATPLEDDAHGFFRLLQLLRPEEFPDQPGSPAGARRTKSDWEARLDAGTPLPPCTSSTRRVDIGGLPPRVAVPIDLRPPDDAQASLPAQLARDGDAQRDPIARGRVLDRIRRALASGAALKAVLGPDEVEWRERADAMDRSDPRLAWLLTQARRWRSAREKTLVFVAHRETLEAVRDALSTRGQVASGVFHEDLSASRRDIEVAQFRAADGPSLLISTEAGGEGRNFEFCHRLVLYDLPWKPSTVEQRIGRLDRIGRRIPVEIVYFRPAAGIGADAVRLYERLGVFREPVAGIEQQLGQVERALEETALAPDASLSDSAIEHLMAEARSARSRVHAAAHHQLHRDPFRAEMGPAILARVPAALDALMERAVVNAASGLGFTVVEVRDSRTYAIEFGNEAIVDALPGVPAGSSFVGTFDRAHAVENETIDFFSSGHALVEGLLTHFEDDPRGRVGRLEVTLPGPPGIGLVVIYKDGARLDVVALDADGRARSDWAAAFMDVSLRVRRMSPDDVAAHDWGALVTRLGATLGTRRPHAAASVVVRSA